MYINYIRGMGNANGGQEWLIGYGVPSLAEGLLIPISQYSPTSSRTMTLYGKHLNSITK